MGNWTRVKWTEARQIGEALGWEGHRLPESDVDPEDHFKALRQAGDQQIALRFLGAALPRYEAVAWAAAELAGRADGAAIGPLERQALDRVMRWVDEPVDEYRLAASEAAERARNGSAEQMLAQAVFLSGGSIAPPDLAAVNPPHHACGEMATAALLIASFREKDPDQALAAMLDSGDRVAARGLEAIARA